MMPLAMQTGTRVPSAPASVRQEGPGARRGGETPVTVLNYFVVNRTNYRESTRKTSLQSFITPPSRRLLFCSLFLQDLIEKFQTDTMSSGCSGEPRAATKLLKK